MTDDVGFALCALGNLNKEEVAEKMNTGRYAMEKKFDGVRVMVKRNNTQVQILTRSGVDVAQHFPIIVSQVRSIPVNFGNLKLILDGELASHNFREVQSAIAGGLPKDKCEFVAFDAISLPMSPELYKLNYNLRRTELMDAIHGTGIVYSASNWENGSPWEDLYEYEFEVGGEGVVLKDMFACYQTGRSQGWLRSKFNATISAFPLDVSGERTVSCGVWETDGSLTIVPICNLLIPDDDMLIMLHRDLKVVIEIEAYGISQNGKLRHPVYKGFRFDVDYTTCTADQLDSFRVY